MPCRANVPRYELLMIKQKVKAKANQFVEHCEDKKKTLGHFLGFDRS